MIQFHKLIFICRKNNHASVGSAKLSALQRILFEVATISGSEDIDVRIELRARSTRRSVATMKHLPNSSRKRVRVPSLPTRESTHPTRGEQTRHPPHSRVVLTGRATLRSFALSFSLAVPVYPTLSPTALRIQLPARRRVACIVLACEVWQRIRRKCYSVGAVPSVSKFQRAVTRERNDVETWNKERSLRRKIPSASVLLFYW